MAPDHSSTSPARAFTDTESSNDLALGPLAPALRPCVRGKFIFVGGEKLYIRGVTYGTFKPDDRGDEFPAPPVVERDFALMAANGVNCIRTYTPPPRWVLDAAQGYGLRVMVGLPVERAIAFLDYRECSRSIEQMVRSVVGGCAGHPAILCYTIGNEVPASIVRWHGRHKVERFLERLYNAAKEEDPGGLVSYVNYPSTEYLRLPFLDFFCFNVYLESRSELEAYVARLHNIAGERPLVMAEIGLDSHRHGEAAQAESLDWQIRSAFAGGCAGVFAYAWTDEWYRGGGDVTDWKFGITDRMRRPKPALAAVRKAYAEAPFMPDAPWPRISVVVCSYNGARTIRDCCEGLRRLDYPDYEVIVVDDGSTDGTAAIARQYGFRIISTENRGLSSARNTGMKASMGEIVAYIDDDAYPDPHWLTYMAASFLSRGSAGLAAVGGPNIPPPDDGPIADCVARAPGGPAHVLLSDRVAEHIPGCNMAIRKSCLEAIGGFDSRFPVAGDDVDLCWRLQKRGWTVGFNPAALVWHHRRNSVRTYWKQQKGYGRAEALLERKWPEKYNAAGHLAWAGRIYGMSYVGWRAGRIYHGTWGLAPYQSLYEPAPSLIESLPMMPEWYLLIVVLTALSGMGAFWSPLRLTLPLLGLAIGAPVLQAARSALRVPFGKPLPPARRLGLRLLTASLHLLQPLARLSGRMHHGLTLWRRRIVAGYAFPRPWTADIWSYRHLAAEERLRSIEMSLRDEGAVGVRGGDYDRWDLEVAGGTLGSARLCMALEHHGSGRQLLRIRSWPRCSPPGWGLIAGFGALSVAAGADGARTAGTVLGLVAVILALRVFEECAAATAAFLRAVRKMQGEEAGDAPRAA